MDGWTLLPAIGKATALLPAGLSQAEYARRSDAAGRTGTIQQSGEGGDDTPFNTSETEANNALRNANYLPLGTADGKRTVVNVSGTLVSNTATQVSDEDFFAFDLRAGISLMRGSPGPESSTPWTWL